MWASKYTYHVKVSDGKIVLLNKVFDSYIHAKDYQEWIEDRYKGKFKIEAFHRKKKSKDVIEEEVA